jgi:rhodanese-related sulfurtransferase
VDKWFNNGFFSHGVYNLTPRESFELCKKGAIIVDVREDYLNVFKMFRVERVLYLPYSHLEELYKELPADKPLIFADAVGLRSREGVEFMISHGYENVANMAGGIVDWERDGLPLTTDINYRLSGSCMCQLKPREGIRRQAAGNRERTK